MSTEQIAALQFFVDGVRRTQDRGRFTFAGASHRMQWNENPYDYPEDLKEEVMARMANRDWAHYPNSLRPYELIDKLGERFDLPPEMI